MARRLRFESRGRFEAPPEALWPFLADTPKLNRAIGLPPIHYTITPAEGGGSHVEAEIRIGGRTISRWTEHPFSWREPFGYVVLREFHGGPFSSASIGVELTLVEGGCGLLVFADFMPRNIVGTVLLRGGLGQRSTDKIVAQCRIFEGYLRGRMKDPFPQLVPRRPLPYRARVMADRLAREVKDRAGVERLYEHLTTARDEEVVKMRPFELADIWGADRRGVLALFLHATNAGLVTMSWDILCPNCRVGKTEFFTLKDLETQAHCDSCNIVFDASFDRLVEVRFTAAPSIRPVVDRVFCIGGPRNTPHVVAQLSVGSGDCRDLVCRLGPGAYRVRSPQAAAAATLEVVENATARKLNVAILPSGIQPRLASVTPGETDLVIENRTEHEALLVVEGDVWPTTIATAATVSTLQEFRDLFSSEALGPGVQLGIRRLAFLFTDVTGSTALYQRVGQARAFRIVQDQFLVLGEAISSHRGALVKTIGDAVMATFETGADALAAAIAMQRNIRSLDVGGAADPARLLRVGLHQGPCVAVNLNDRLDYFGTTVNVASRVEHEARGGEIVATAEICDLPDARAILAEAGTGVTPDLVRLRGVTQPVAVYRVVIP